MQIRFEFHTAVKMSVSAFWVRTLCGLVSICWQYVSPKHWYPPPNSHGVSSRKCDIDRVSISFQTPSAYFADIRVKECKFKNHNRSVTAVLTSILHLLPVIHHSSIYVVSNIYID
jgi:hypothetical protein